MPLITAHINPTAKPMLPNGRENEIEIIAYNVANRPKNAMNILFVMNFQKLNVHQ